MLSHRSIGRLWIAAALSLTGAANAQNQAPATTPATPAQKQAADVTADTAVPRVDDAMLTPAPAPTRVLRTWQDAIALLRKESTGIRTTRARIAQAEAQARLALSPALPSLVGDASVTHHLLREPYTDTAGVERRFPDPATEFGAALTLRVPLIAPRSWYDHGTARDAVDAAKLSALEVERLEVAVAANAIVTVVTAERLAEVSRVSLRSALSTLDLNRRRAELGASSMVDVLRAEQEVSLSRAQVVSADESLLRAREALGLALGTHEAYGVVPDIRIDTLAQDARANCKVEKDIQARPDVQAAQAALRISERHVRAITYDYLPTVDATSQLAYTSAEYLNGQHVTWTIGALLSWPLYDGGLRYANRSVREAESVVAREQLTQTSRRATLEVSQAFRGVKTAQANVNIARKTREISAETARLARVAFLNGSGTSFDLVDTARQLREAEIDLAIKEFEVLRAQIAALLALATCRV